MITTTQRPTGGGRDRAAGAKPGLREGFAALDRYPVLRYGRKRLLAAAQQPIPSVAAMVAAIEADVALTARVLAAANAATGGRSRPSAAVLGVPQAVEVLDAQGVLAVATGAPHAGFFARAGVSFSLEVFRVHAVSVRRAGEIIMHVCRPAVSADFVYAVAILHDIGKLVLALTRPSGDSDPEVETSAQPGSGDRRSRGPLDHAAVGAALAAHWGLPAAITGAIAHHHTPGAGTASDVVALADLLSHYVQGRALSPAALATACEPLGVTDSTLADLLYQASSGGGAPPRQMQACPLSHAELQALRGLREGKHYKEIAVARGVAVSTIRSQMHSVYHKLGVSDRAQAVLLGASHGWL